MVPPPAKDTSINAKRTWHHKRRSGCITCKSRHVKCDEGKPSCAKCLASGRVCDGYETPAKIIRPRAASFRRFAATLTIIQRPIPSALDGGEKESQALQYFFVRSLPILDAPSKPSAWARPLIFLQQNEPVLRRCCAALGSLHGVTAASGKYPDEPLGCSRDTFSLRYSLNVYNKALHSLRCAMGSIIDQHTLRLACIMLTVYDSLLGRSDEMNVHLCCGLQVLDCARAGTSSEGSAIEVMVSWLGFVQALCERHRITGTPEVKRLLFQNASSEPLTLRDAADAKLELNRLKMAILGFIHIITVNPRQDRAAVEETQFMLRARLYQWKGQLEAQMSNPSSALSQAPPWTIDLLRAQYHMTHVFFTACSSQRQLTFDGLLAEFFTVIELVEKTFDPDVGSYHLNSVFSMFSLSLEVIPLLFLTAQFCRHPIIRTKALRLLNHVPQRECLWDAKVAAIGVKTLINFEQGDAAEAPTTSPFGVPEDRRIELVQMEKVAGPDSNQLKVLLCYRRGPELSLAQSALVNL